MRRPFSNRSLFFQLLAGTMSILATVALLVVLVGAYYLRAAERADSRRWVASELSRQASAAHRAEREFVLHDATQDDFYQTGISPALTEERAAAAKLVQDIDSLMILSEAGQRDAEERMRTGVTTYDTTVDDLVRAYQKRGNATHGIEGQWRSAVAALVSRWRGTSAAAERDAGRLQTAQRDYLANPGVGTEGAVMAASAALAADARGVSSAEDAVDLADSLFQQYREIEDVIKPNATDGLQGRVEAAIRSIQPEADSILTAAADSSQAAMTRLNIATPLALLFAMGLAAAFLYLFATSVSRTTTDLGTAATQIGRGHFHVRVATVGGDELSQLGQEFNRMAENLGALVSTVQKSGIQINTSVMEIAATARQQQTTATEIAATTSEVGATARQISATSQELSNNMQQVATGADRAADLAGSGQSGIARMATTMEQISRAAEAISNRLTTLSDKASNINTVVTTITKVADQTNLLSLNAAIEAEKAGEYGRGFAVVAAEIRRLADQTALATGDIDRIVKEIQSAVTAGVMGMDKFSDEVSRGVEASREVGEQLSGIIQQVQTLTPNFEMVNEGMRSQAEGAQQISDALAQLVSASQQTTESLVQSNKAIEGLNEASRGLQAGVARFTIAA